MFKPKEPGSTFISWEQHRGNVVLDQFGQFWMEFEHCPERLAYDEIYVREWIKIKDKQISQEIA